MSGGWILLVYLIVGWILSGSFLPSLVTLGGTVVFLVLRWAPFAWNRLVILSFVLLLVTLQSFGFRSGYGMVTYEELPWIYHAGMGCLIWAWFVEMLRDGGRIGGAGWIFRVQLGGALILFWIAANSEIYRYDPWLVRSLASVPLVLTVLREFHRLQPVHWRRILLAVLVAAPLLGQWGMFSKSFSNRLFLLLGREEETVQFTGDRVYEVRGTGFNRGDRSLVELPRRADIQLDDSVRFFLNVPSVDAFREWIRRPLYVRTSTVSLFRNDETIGPLRRGQWIFDSDDGAGDQVTTLPEKRPERAPLEYSVLIQKGDVNRLPLVDGTDRIRADGVYEFAESWYQLSPETDSDWIRFGAIGAPEGSREDIFPGMAGPVSPEHIQLPVSPLASRIRELTTRVVAESGGGSRAPRAIRDYIRKNTRYSLKYRNPQNLSPVENLLFGEKKGHCELYAAATLMMLRSAGIPSRIAYGYTGGVANEAELAIAFRGRDIHAWTEIMDESGHWRIFDSTPSGAGASRTAATGSRTAIPWELASVDVDDIFLMGEFEGVAGTSSRLKRWFEDVTAWASDHFVILLSAGLAAFALLRWLALRYGWVRPDPYRNPESVTGFSGPVVSRARPDFVDAIHDLGDRAGIARIPGRTFREYVAELRANGIGYADLEEAVDYFYGVQYTGLEKDPVVERRILKSVRQYRKGSG